MTANERTAGMRYSLTALSPNLTATALANSGSAPNSIVVPMTALPPTTPAVFGDTALVVTSAGDSDYEKAVLLQNWFREDNRFTYSTDRRPGSGMRLLADFITTDRVGYCEQFAAAYAVLARSLGLPARVVVGFLDGSEVSGGRREFTTEDLHAWPEVYFGGLGWVRFEPTPGGRTGAAPAYTRESVQESPSQPAPSVAAPTRVPRTGAEAGDPGSADGSGGLPLVGWLNWLGWTLLVILVLALTATPRLVREARRRRWLGASDAVGLANGAWAELVATATDAGLPLRNQATLRRLSAELVGLTRGTADQQRELAMLVEVVERARYARTYEADADERRRIIAAVREWNDVIMSAAPPRRRRWSAWWPQSLFSGPTRLGLTNLRVPDRAGAASAPRDGA